MSADAKARSLAQTGLQRVEDAFLEWSEHHPKRLSNVDIAEILGLHSSVRGGRRNYLTYSILGGLLADGRIARDETSRTYTKV